MCAVRRRPLQARYRKRRVHSVRQQHLFHGARGDQRLDVRSVPGEHGAGGPNSKQYYHVRVPPRIRGKSSRRGVRGVPRRQLPGERGERGLHAVRREHVSGLFREFARRRQVCGVPSELDVGKRLVDRGGLRVQLALPPERLFVPTVQS